MSYNFRDIGAGINSCEFVGIFFDVATEATTSSMSYTLKSNSLPHEYLSEQIPRKVSNKVSFSGTTNKLHA